MNGRRDFDIDVLIAEQERVAPSLGGAIFVAAVFINLALLGVGAIVWALS